MRGAARLAALVSLLLHGPGVARAHVGHVILRAERYLKLDVAGNDARLVVSLTLGAREGWRVLQAADADGDGEVSAREADAYLARWGRGLEEELPVSVDGARLELAWGEGYFEPIGPVRRIPLTVEMIAHFELEGERTVRIEDRMVRREVFDRTDVAFRTRDGARLLASGIEGEADEPTSDLAYAGDFRRDAEAVPLVARVSAPARPTSWPGSRWAWGGLLLLAPLAWLGYRARQRRRPA